MNSKVGGTPSANKSRKKSTARFTCLESAARERQLRVLFALDPRRTAILLIGGDKTGDSGWYDRYVPIADDLLDKHLRELEESRGKEL